MENKSHDEPLLKENTENNSNENITDQQQNKIDQIINQYSSHKDSYLNANFISKMCFYWAFKAIKVNYNNIN